MIDELAKALCGSANKMLDWGNPCIAPCNGCKMQARALLRRLREPTEAMLAAGTAAITGGPEPDPDYAVDADAMYRAMIGAALGEMGA